MPSKQLPSSNSAPASRSCLLIDAGNTRIKWIVYTQGKVLHSGYCLTADAHTGLWQQLSQTPSIDGVHFAAGVCVAGDAVQQVLSEQVLQLAGVKLQWLKGNTALLGLRNDYATPHTLGADRWFAAYGLLNQWPDTQAFAVLASFGTATTVDVVYWDEQTHTHVFAGGIILAGLSAAWRSVSHSTAQLPDVSQVSPAAQQALAAVPNSTEQALLNGALWAQAGAVERMFAVALHQFGSPTASRPSAPARRGGALLIAGGAGERMLVQFPQAKRCQHPVFKGLIRWSAAYLKP